MGKEIIADYHSSKATEGLYPEFTKADLREQKRRILKLHELYTSRGISPVKSVFMILDRVGSSLGYIKKIVNN